MKICHFISGLHSGGTEKNLLHLINNDRKNDLCIYSFKKNNFYFKKKKNLKILLPKNNNFFSTLNHIFKIPIYLLKQKPDRIISWMSHANVVVGLFSFFIRKKVIWNIRSSGDEYYFFNKNFLIYNLQSILSYFVAEKIIFNSKYSKDNHIKLLINRKISVVINNGFEKQKIQNQKIKNKNINFLCVARYHPIKNHLKLLKAFILFDKDEKNWKLTLLGRDVFKLKKDLKELLITNNILKKISFVDEYKNLNKVYKKFDFHVLASDAESFPNVIGESMSHGLPAISVDVGDVRKLIFEKRLISKKNNFYSIAATLLQAKKIYKNKKNYNKLRLKCKDFIDKKFPLSKMIYQFKNHMYLKK